MYLANDVIQNSKKKGPEFGREYASVLRKAFENFAGPECDEKTKRSLNRILQVWEERGVYDAKLIKEFKKGLGKCLGFHFKFGISQPSSLATKCSKSYGMIL